MFTSILLTTWAKDCPSDPRILWDENRKEIGWPLFNAFPIVTISGAILWIYIFKNDSIEINYEKFWIILPLILIYGCEGLYLKSPPVMSKSSKTRLYFIAYYKPSNFSYKASVRKKNQNLEIHCEIVIHNIKH